MSFLTHFMDIVSNPALFYYKSMSERDNFINHINDLADRCYQKNIYTYSDFLGMDEISEFYRVSKEFSFVHYELWGGYENSERKILRFGSAETLGYDENWPLTLLEAAPLIDKFADELGHRDFLGALMNLGIERSVLGDIIVESPRAYFFVQDSMADYIIENLTRIKKTTVNIKKVDTLPAVAEKEPRPVSIQIPSERLDVIIDRVYKMSRDAAVSLFKEGKVFINGRLCESNSKNLKPEDVVTVRGYGKFCYKGTTSVSKKGKLNATVFVY